MAAKLAALIVPLGLDTFAVAAALGASGVSRIRGLRISALFSAFEAGMPLLGLALGRPLGNAVGADADYIAVGVLVAFGAFTLLGAEREEELPGRLEQLRGLGALALGLSVSLDELAIGFAMGLLRLPVALVIVLIAAQAFAAAQLGLRLGRRLSERRREAAERLAGLALIVLGAVLLAEHGLG